MAVRLRFVVGAFGCSAVRFKAYRNEARRPTNRRINPRREKNLFLGIQSVTFLRFYALSENC